MNHILEKLSTGDADSRYTFAWSLVQDTPNDSANIRDVIEALGEAELSNTYARWALINVLKHCGEQAHEALPLLEEAVQDNDESVAKEALNAIAQLRTKAFPAVALLSNMLDHHDPKLRKRSAIALGQIGFGASEAIPSLIKHLNDPDESVSEMSLYALFQINSEVASKHARANALKTIAGIVVVPNDQENPTKTNNGPIEPESEIISKLDVKKNHGAVLG